MALANDQWRSLHQKLPLDLYERWKVQMKRIAIANGISAEAFESDDKFAETIGPKVMTYETILILMERSDESTFRV
jgi:hypothetical protein